MATPEGSNLGYRPDLDFSAGQYAGHGGPEVSWITAGNPSQAELYRGIREVPTDTVDPKFSVATQLPAEGQAPAGLSLLGGETDLVVPASVVSEYGIGAQVLGTSVCGKLTPYGGIPGVPRGLVDLESVFRSTSPPPDQEIVDEV